MQRRRMNLTTGAVALRQGVEELQAVVERARSLDSNAKTWSSPGRALAIELAELTDDAEAMQTAQSIPEFGDVDSLPSETPVVKRYVLAINEVRARVAQKSLAERVAGVQKECDEQVREIRQQALKRDRELESDYRDIAQLRNSAQSSLTDRLNEQAIARQRLVNLQQRRAESNDAALRQRLDQRIQRSQRALDQLLAKVVRLRRRLVATDARIIELIGERRKTVNQALADEMQEIERWQDLIAAERERQEQIDRKRAGLLGVLQAQFAKEIGSKGKMDEDPGEDEDDDTTTETSSETDSE